MKLSFAQLKYVTIPIVLCISMLLTPLHTYAKEVDTYTELDETIDLLKAFHISGVTEEELHQYAYTLEENLAGVMSTVDPSSPAYAQTEAVLGQMFAIYDLDRVNTTEVLEVQDSQAIVKTITTTTKISGPEFPVQKVVSTNLVNKVNGQWKLYSTTPDYIDMLIADSIVQGEVTITKAEQDATKSLGNGYLQRRMQYSSITALTM